MLPGGERLQAEVDKAAYDGDTTEATHIPSQEPQGHMAGVHELGDEQDPHSETAGSVEHSTRDRFYESLRRLRHYRSTV